MCTQPQNYVCRCEVCVYLVCMFVNLTIIIFGMNMPYMSTQCTPKCPCRQENHMHTYIRQNAIVTVIEIVVP